MECLGILIHTLYIPGDGPPVRSLFHLLSLFSTPSCAAKRKNIHQDRRREDREEHFGSAVGVGSCFEGGQGCVKKRASLGAEVVQK